MSIVLELQQEAIDSNSDILSLLRKALLVARKLGLKDFEEWINCELNGYQDAANIPDYRNLHGELKGWNPYHGWISVVIQDIRFEEIFTNRKTYQSIPSICSLLSPKNEIANMPMPASVNVKISELTGFDTKYTLFIPHNQISNIIDQVKNKILDWSLILEESGIIGEGLSFSNEEKEKAQSEPQIVNYISNFNGDVINSQMQQGTENSTQNK